jgi:hypothetical protein
VIYGADDRYIGNIFLGGDVAAAYGPAAYGTAPAGYGTAGYDGHPATLEEYLARVAVLPGGDRRRFPGVKQPAYLRPISPALAQGCRVTGSGEPGSRRGHAVAASR